MGLSDAALALGGGFGGLLVNPLGWLLVLAAGVALRSPDRLRLAAGAAGALLGAFESLGEPPLHHLLAAVGSAAGGVVLAEVWLLAVLPACRWVWGMCNALTRGIAGIVRWLLGPSPPPGTAADRDAD